ncbi:Calcium-transporting ATPase 1 [Sphaceloma murrayae]|uniref:P-type Ca(2+) transporter n=1 Tax=Sphaceloma murrayae TaxID=2082308 RepID=A0A2K1QZX3_9PEZI|nr:Calcium-transporting ATPase 1 [Sphaceloma murrayae]
MSRSSTPALPFHNETTDFKESRGPALELEDLNGNVKKPRRASTLQSITPLYSSLSPEESAHRLQTSLTGGLHPGEAQARLLDHGSNELPHEEPEPLWLRFLKQFKETLILLLLASAAISAFMGNFEDAVSIAVAVTIVVSVAFVQEYRSEKSLEALNSLVPHGSNVIRSTEVANNSSGANGSAEGRLSPKPGSDNVAASQRASKSISASLLVPGDLVLFTTGDRIPADIRITQCADLTIDESNLTGENEPVHKQADALDSDTRSSNGSTVPPSPNVPLYSSPASGTVGADLRLNDQTNIAFMGTLVRSGYGQGIVVGTGANTEFGAISASLQSIESPRTPLQLSMDRLGKELSYMSFGVIAFIMLIGLWRGYPFLELFQIGVSLAVAAIPEGLPIIVTVTLALGVLRMSKRHAIVRRLPSVETLGSVNVICSDKTGTLTTNHMTVTKMWHFGNQAPVDILKVHATVPSDAVTRTILRIGNIVNNGRLSSTGTSHATAASAAILSSTAGKDAANAKSRWTGQPTDVALLDLVDAFGEEDLRTHVGDRRNETPFSSERKWMGCVVPNATDSHAPDVAYIKGALEQVLKRCDTYIDGQGSEVVLDEQRKQEAFAAAESMAQEGLRVLGVANGPILSPSRNLKVPGANRSGRNTPSPLNLSSSSTQDNEHLYQGLCFAGLVGMNDPPRKGIERSIRRLMAGGVKVIMITGDAETTAVAIAKKLGMPINMNSALGSPVLRGEELDRMSIEELEQAIARTQIFARTSPDHKMKIIKALQARGDVVAMTGDGVNDAPALKKADIGISMGKLGTDVAKEAADMILTDDDFSTILNAIEEGKGIFYNIQNFLTFQLSTSAAALGLVMLSSAFGLKNPLNAMQILWINILMDGPPAQSLGVEPVDAHLLSLPPRSRHARVLTPRLLRRVLQSSSIIMLGTLYTYWSNLTTADMAARSVSPRDTTLTFTAFVLFDMFNALTCRSASKSVLDGTLRLFGKGSNRMFNFAIGSSLLGQLAVIYFPPLQSVFQTEALSGRDLGGLVMLASTVFWVDEGRKWYERRRWGRQGAVAAQVGVGAGARGGQVLGGYSGFV